MTTNETLNRFADGSSFEGYTIVRLLATGGMGEVYEATHTFTGRAVALKVLKLGRAASAEAIRRAKLEAVVLSKLNHPNVVKVHDANIVDEAIVWIAMERLQGCTLRELIHRRGALPPAVAVRYATLIGAGIDAAHSIGAIHRDLKPENVFVTADDEIKVLDLGTAKFYASEAKLTERAHAVGTPAYMSPEQLLGEPLDRTTDVYALGLVLYEMIAGSHAFAKNGILPHGLAWGTAHLVREPPSLHPAVTQCPVELAAIVARAIRKERGERHPTMAALLRDLDAVSERLRPRDMDAVAPEGPPGPRGIGGTLFLGASAPPTAAASSRPIGRGGTVAMTDTSSRRTRRMHVDANEMQRAATPAPVVVAYGPKLQAASQRPPSSWIRRAAGPIVATLLPLVVAGTYLGVRGRAAASGNSSVALRTASSVREAPVSAEAGVASAAVSASTTAAPPPARSSVRLDDRTLR